MRGFTVFLFILGAAAQAQAGELKLLLTSFDPFGGSAKNNTQAIVAELVKQGLGKSVSISTCNLPVVYDQAAKVAEDCIAREKPDVVVSFGEAGCSLRIETAATNLDDSPGFPDNAGQIRSGTEIVLTAPNRIGFSFPVDQMFCAVSPQIEDALEVSISPGAFVCNNTAFHLSTDLTGKGIPFTFIHVPNSRCEDAQANPEKNAAVLIPMLKAAVFSLRATSGKSRIMPIDRSTAQSYLSELAEPSEAKASVCELRFAQRVFSAY